MEVMTPFSLLRGDLRTLGPLTSWAFTWMGGLLVAGHVVFNLHIWAHNCVYVHVISYFDVVFQW